MGDALTDIAEERQRQIVAEGWTPEHDDGHSEGEMAIAAALYALHGTPCQGRYEPFSDGGDPAGWPEDWPWNPVWWKPKDARRNLIRAAALIVAEIERLDRAATAPQPWTCPHCGKATEPYYSTCPECAVMPNIA